MRRQQSAAAADRQVLIPGLRDSLALLCLARVPRENYSSLKRVSRLWHSAVISKHLYKLRKRLGLREPWIYVPFFCPKWSFVLPEVRRGPSNWLEAYDPVRNSWHHIGAIPGVGDSELLKGFSTAAIGHKVFVIGGRISSLNEEDLRVTADVYSLNCINGNWRQCASMGQARADFACTVAGGLIYVAGGRSDSWHERGGYSAEVYDPKANTWTALPRMCIGRYRCAGVAMHGRVYVVGGFAEAPKYGNGGCGSPVYGVERSSVDVYDPKTGRWSLIKGMWQLDVPPNQIVSMPDGRLYSLGDVLNIWKGRLVVYDEKLNIWKIVDGSQSLRNLEIVDSEQRYLTMAPVGGTLVFIGGYRRCITNAFSDGDEDNVEEEEQEEDHHLVQATGVFDTSNGTWINKEPLVSDRCKDLCSHSCSVTL